jgi:molybdenum cofactor cytidylyltransferase
VPSPDIVGILLAAGSGSRFGADKLLHPLLTGVPIALTAARQLRGVLPRCVAVVRPGADQLAGLLRAEGFEVVTCANAQEGMGASLACAVGAAGDAAGYLVALADMPFIRTSTLEAVRDALAGGASLVAPYFRTRRGHPVGLSGRHRQALLAATGDEGARQLLSEQGATLIKVPVGDPGVIRDIDTPGDLAPPVQA